MQFEKKSKFPPHRYKTLFSNCIEAFQAASSLKAIGRKL